MAEEGLQYLAEARDATGLPIVTEVLTPADVPLVAKYADVLQIGTRNMQNFLLLRACGAIRTPILLKRGMSATLEEYLLAAEYILAGGNQRVLLCERGIRTFENYVRNTFALAMVPTERKPTCPYSPICHALCASCPPDDQSRRCLRRRRHPDRSPPRSRKGAHRQPDDQREGFREAGEGMPRGG